MTRNSKAPEVTADIGRPAKFTPARRAAIVDAISHRIPYEYAAEANGICEKTLYNWLDTAYAHQAQGIDSDYTQFLQDIKRAEMQRMREHSDIISARPERWQADAWMLERRWPKHYGNNVLLKELNERMIKMQEADNGSGKEENNREDDQA